MENYTKGNIIYIEDDKLDQISFINFIDEYKLNYNCTIANSLKEAKKLLNHKHYDIALIDYKLSDGTAFDVIEKIKGTPFIILTGVGDEIVATQAMKRGAYDYIIKDLRGSYLKSLPMIIENTLKRKQIEEELKRYQDNLEVMVKERTEQLKFEIDEHENDVEKTMIHKKELQENIKEMRCFLNILNISENVDLTLHQKLNEVVKMLPNAFQYPGKTCVKIKYGNFEYLSNNFNETSNKLNRDLIVENKKIGQIEVYLLDENTEIDKELFIESDILFLDTFSNYLINLIINIKKIEFLNKFEKEHKNKFKYFTDRVKILNKKIKHLSNFISNFYIDSNGYIEIITELSNKNKNDNLDLVYLKKLKESLNSLKSYNNSLEEYSKEIKTIIKQNKF